MKDVFNIDVLPVILSFMNFNDKIRLRRVSKKFRGLIDTLKCHQNLVIRKTRGLYSNEDEPRARHWSYGNPNLANHPLRECDVLSIKAHQIQSVFAFLRNKEMFSNLRNLYVDEVFIAHLNETPYAIELIQLINAFQRLETLEICGRIELRLLYRFYFAVQLDLNRLKYFNGQIAGRNLILNTPHLTTCSTNSLENLELLYPLQLSAIEIFYFDFKRLKLYPNSEAAIIKLFDNIERLTFWAVKHFEVDLLIDLIKSLPKLTSLSLFNRRKHAIFPDVQFTNEDLAELIREIKKMKRQNLSVFLNGLNLVQCFDKSDVFVNSANYYQYDSETDLTLPVSATKGFCLQDGHLQTYLKLFLEDRENQTRTKEKNLQDNLPYHLKMNYGSFTDATSQPPDEAAGREFLRRFIKITGLMADRKIEEKDRPKFYEFLQFIEASFSDKLDELILWDTGMPNDFYGSLSKYCPSLRSLQIREEAQLMNGLDFNFLFDLKQLRALDVHFRFYYKFVNQLFERLKHLRRICMSYDGCLQIQIDKVVGNEVFHGFEFQIKELKIRFRIFDLNDEKLDEHIKQRIDFPGFTFSNHS